MEKRHKTVVDAPHAPARHRSEELESFRKLTPQRAQWQADSPGQEPARAQNGEEQIQPKTDNKEVIPPPPTGDDDIYIEAPNPEAAHEEEVIPPPSSSDANPSIETR